MIFLPQVLSLGLPGVNHRAQLVFCLPVSAFPAAVWPFFLGECPALTLKFSLQLTCSQSTGGAVA